MRSYPTIATALLLVLMIGTAASGEPTRLLAEQNPVEVSTFTLSFTDFGIDSTSSIIDTNYELRTDIAAAEVSPIERMDNSPTEFSRSARFVNYFQNVEPLILPDPSGETAGISTGNLRIEVLPGTSTGTYNPATGEFTTTEFYVIRFDGDLSGFGLESPVILPSTSNGTVVFDSEGIGRIDMVWSGQGELANLQDPANPIRFTYECATQTEFQALSLGDNTGDGVVNLADFAVLANCFGRNAPGGSCPVVDFILTDLSGDGRVNLVDFATFSLYFDG